MRCKSWLQWSSCIFTLFSPQYCFPFIYNTITSPAFTSPLPITSILFYYLFYIYYLPLGNWKLQVTPTQHANLTHSLQVVTKPHSYFLFNKSNFFFPFNLYHYYSGSNIFPLLFKHLLNWSWSHRVNYQICPLCKEICMFKHIRNNIKHVREHIRSFTGLRGAAPESLCSRHIKKLELKPSLYFLNYYFLNHLTLLSPFSLSSAKKDLAHLQIVFQNFTS